VVDGIPPKLVEPFVAAYGNAVVPQVAEWIGRRLMTAITERSDAMNTTTRECRTLLAELGEPQATTPAFTTAHDGARRLQRPSGHNPARQRTQTREPLRRGWLTMKLERAIEDYLAHLRTFGGRGKGASPHTLRGYRGDLTRFVAYIRSVRGQRAGDVTDFDQEMAEGWLASLEGFRLARATMARAQTALRSFAKWGTRRRYWRANPVVDIDLIRVPERLPRPFAPEELAALGALALSEEETALRSLLYYAGLRVSEVCGIRLRDLRNPFVDADGAVHEARVHVLGKGNKERAVTLNDRCWRAIEAHVNRRAPDDRSREAFLFEHRHGDAWTPRMIEKRMRRWGVRAGVASATPHRLRHSLASDLYEATEDLGVVQEMLGHANISTTRGYAKLSGRRKEAAVRKLPAFGDAVIAPSYRDEAAPSPAPSENPAPTQETRTETQ
jgi:integrase/recombinase XerC